jgi:flavin reductase (DIM6/NTAB) family NADH-FMN oxidoreductase RutF
MAELISNPFELFDKRWALVTAGNLQNFNTMTISWGSAGTLWSRPIVNVYIRHDRYTYEFMEKNDFFTVSFYPENFKDDLMILGRNSGRNTNKVSMTDLTAEDFDGSVTFKQASITLLCKKIYFADLDRSQLPADMVEKIYGDAPTHRMYIGEVIKTKYGLSH